MSSITHCRVCGESTLHPVLDLGSTPLANALPTQDELHLPEEHYPLELVFCPACTLLQITETVPPEKLFSSYLYFSSFSDTMVRHAKQLAEEVIPKRSLNAQSTVVEIASNDGYLLQHYQNAGIGVLGIDPARNIAEVANQKGIPTRCAFFGAKVAEEMVAEGTKADVIHLHNVLAHVADQHDVVAGIKILLKEDGIVITESPYAIDTIDHTEFDQIYHEHLCYFSLTSLQKLFALHDLAVVDVEHVPIHGGSLRVTLAHAAGAEPAPSVEEMLRQEKAWGVWTIDPYRDFANRVTQWKQSMIDPLQTLKNEGKSLAAYGASAKGCTLLHYCGLGKNVLDFVVDRSTYKQGRFTPGTHLPILAPEALLERKPDAVLLLTWNFQEEILQQQAAYLERGGAFILPFPKPTILYHSAHEIH